MVRIDIELIEGSPDGAHTVAINGGDDEITPGLIGTVHPTTEAGVWEFKPDQKISGMEGFPGDGKLILRADGIEALRAAFKDRFIAMEIRQESKGLSCNTMKGHAFSVIRSLNILGCKTDSNAGFFAAMADALAHSIVEDFQPEDRESTLALFVETVQRFMKEIEARDKEREALKAALDSGDLRAVLKGALGDLANLRARGGDPTQH